MLRFDPIEHKYWWDTDEGSIEIPSVSRLLEPLREPFSAPLDVVDKARRRGERVHLMTHQHDTGQYVDTFSIEPDIYDDCLRMFDAYVKWVTDKEVIKSEFIVSYYDEDTDCGDCKHDGDCQEDECIMRHPLYGGQLDKIYLIDGVEPVFDIKCTSGIYDTHGLQVFMYHVAHYGDKWKSAPPPGILRLSIKGKAFVWHMLKEEMQMMFERARMLVVKYWYWDVYKNRRGLKKC